MDPVRRAYVTLVGDLPAAFVGGAVDIRPMAMATAGQETARFVILSGEDDLVELRAAVERVTGPMTWPLRSAVDSRWRLVETHTGYVRIDRPAQLMSLVVALGDRLGDNSGAWRTRKTMYESVALALSVVESVTVAADRYESVQEFAP